MPPKGKGKEKKPMKVDLKSVGEAPKPKKIPPPPKCFSPEDLARYKETFKLFDEDNIDKIPLHLLGTMLRKLGFNPKGYEIKELLKMFLEDEYVEEFEYHEFLFMIEAKKNWGDDFERDVFLSFQALGHDDDEKGVINIDTLKEELMNWGEPLSEIEFQDLPKMALKEKFMVFETGMLSYQKFIESMNEKDAMMRAVPEPVNFFKLDQKTLAAMAIAKAQAERQEEEKKAAEKKAREEARRQKMIADGLLPPD